MTVAFPLLRFRWAVALLTASVLVAFSARPYSTFADAPEFTPTQHSEYQAVYDDGTSAWVTGGYRPIEMVGVVINNPWQMLNYETSSSPEWQVFFQAVEPGDYGGTAMYMRRFAPAFLGGANLFVGTQWNEEMARLNYPVYEPTGELVSEPLRYGDLIRVQANAPGLFYGGKMNINTQHSSDPLKSFSITILERDWEPTAAQITLADLKDDSDGFIFDENRLVGCEHYQGSLVHLDNLLLDDDPANWYLNNVVTVRQGDLTMPLQLGIDPELGWIDPFALTTTAFSVTAILNQESGGGPHTGGYRLWLTSADGLQSVPEPSSIALAVMGCIGMIAVVRRQRRRITG